MFRKSIFAEVVRRRIFLVSATFVLCTVALSSFVAAAPKVVPAFTLSDFRGQQISLQQYRGKVVMINFWATWCAPCVEEFPTMLDLKKSLDNQPFEILAINMGEDAEAIQRFADRLNLDFNFPVLVDNESKVAEKYKVKGLPATMLVNKQGEFAFGGIGARDWNGKKAREEILPLLDEPYEEEAENHDVDQPVIL